MGWHDRWSSGLIVVDDSAAWRSIPDARPNSTDRSQRDRGSRIDRCADDTDADECHTGANTGAHRISGLHRYTDTDADDWHTGADTGAHREA